MYITGRTAQIEMEMDRYRLDIIGLSEIRWPMNGKTTLQSGKLMLYSGKEDGLHQEGVGIMLRKKAKKSLMEWKPINERMMYARFCSPTLQISFIVVYAPTNESTKRQRRHSWSSYRKP